MDIVRHAKPTTRTIKPHTSLLPCKKMPADKQQQQQSHNTNPYFFQGCYKIVMKI